MSAETRSVGARIDGVLDRTPQELVIAYFEVDSVFAGALFDDLGENEPYRVTRDDLFAVSMLDVSFGPRAVRYLLDERNEEAISSYLHALDPKKAIWSVPESLLAGPANDLWRFVNEPPGMGPVITGKLLARKRPHLIPIFDRAVRAQLGIKSTEQHFWQSIREALLDIDRRARLAALQPPGVRKISVLRLLDVMLWMNGSQSSSAKAARLKAGVTT